MAAKKKDLLVGVVIVTPGGASGEVVSVDKENGTLKVRFHSGHYADYSYQVTAPE